MSFEIEGLQEFISAVKEAADGVFADQLGLWLEGMGMQFLDLIQDEIIRTETVDTRRLLNSFSRSDEENMWSISSDRLSLEVGTNVNYASFANDGHFTVDPNSGKDRRWVPGRWKGDRFEYDPSERETGMLLKIQWVDGSGYWDNALAIFDKMFEKSLDRLLQKWLDSHF
ncbi:MULTISPECIES: HK97 gp10 family phage protein [Clostridia]|uniref:HK97 gp10 family phage protein n=1 Tax=Clostridia TaxID=186801 RepID=UPI000EA3FCCF|nr:MULTISPECIES: HK97 gp10 family phage protein [Clostridia]NBJ68908.1 HK97 gp10 family phage protein [Roseburia sp. 1XD42-34]RKI80280.1 HK97 gp10 family phage protein [Clostridium sp. 1xD42-85]